MQADSRPFQIRNALFKLMQQLYADKPLGFLPNYFKHYLRHPMKQNQLIEFDGTLESLQKIFVLAEHIDIKVGCKQCGEALILILGNDSLERDGQIFPGPGLFCPNGHISMLWSPPPKSELELFWEKFENCSQPDYKPIPLKKDFKQKLQPKIAFQRRTPSFSKGEARI